jgi:hypothetical protein
MITRMSEKKELLTTNRKALTVNLDESKYGTFAEIGAGQEVARIFFSGGRRLRYDRQNHFGLRHEFQ